MKAFLPFLVIGVTTGAVYALVSMGLVLSYTTSGVFNFAHGAVGMFATYVFYELRAEVGLPTVVAAGVAVLGVAPIMGLLIDRVLLRRMEGASSSATVVVSLGLLVALQGFVLAVFGAEVRRVPAIFPTWTFRIPGANVGVDQTIVVAIAIAAGIALVAYLHGTHVGLQNRAVVADRELAELVGTNTRSVTSRAWMLSCAFAAVAGIVFTPFVQLDTVLLTLLVVQAFGAAIVGRLRSLPLTNLGAYGIAIAAALVTKYQAGHPGLAGLPTSLPFIVLFAVLIFSRKGSFAEVGSARLSRRRSTTATRPGRFPVGTVAVGVAVAAFLPAFLDGPRLLTATSTVSFVLVFASLSLVVGLARQVSLCHAVFVVFGATTLAHLSALPDLLALFVAALVLVPVGALVAIPALRLSGLFLALATFGFGVLAQYLIFPTHYAFGAASLIRLSRPAFAQTDTAFYYLVLAVVVAGVLVVEMVRVTRLGRILRVLADSPTGVESLGVEPTTARVLVLCLSAFLAALAGGLQGWQFQVLSLASFGFFNSLLWVTVLVAAGAATLSGSIGAALLLVTVPAVFTSPAVTEWLPVAFGVSAMVLAQAPNGLASLLRWPDLAGLAAQRAFRLDHRRQDERLVVALATEAH
jgi:branched-subunit amino acid ABC-type transport system permease component